MHVTHEAARRWIQFELDGALSPKLRNQLAIHLHDCAQCRVYAQDLMHLQTVLMDARQQHAQRKPIPLSIRALTEKSRKKSYNRFFLAMRTSLITLLLAAFAFNAWTFFSADDTPPAITARAGVQPVPTPSTNSTITGTVTKECPRILYSVQDNDTLASIAEKFSISKDEIATLNSLKTESILTPQLWIPVCGSTPTGTAEGLKFLTKTHTPRLHPTTSTPGDGY